MKSSLTPMMKQFFDIKQQHPDFIIFFRLGDFYEIFDQDALKVSPLLGLSLTKRQEFYMCGFPHHAKNNYIHRLVKEKIKIAICEQVEEIANNKKFFNRKVVELITPGTFTSDMLDSDNSSHFLMSFSYSPKSIALCFADVSTGKFMVNQIENDSDIFKSFLERFHPSEIIYNSKHQLKADSIINNFYKTPLSDHYFSLEDNEALLKRHFNVVSLESINITSPEMVSACGAALKYIQTNLFKETLHINQVEYLNDKEFVFLSDSTIKNLELVESIDKHQSAFSLFHHLNKTKTAMGSRYLKHLILHPSTDPLVIENRLESVFYFRNHIDILSQVQEKLHSIPDIERLLGKIALSKANPRDVWNFYLGLKNLESLKTTFTNIPFLQNSKTPSLSHLTQLIETYLQEEPPLHFGEDPVIKENFSQQLDILRKKVFQSYHFLLEIEKREQEKTQLSKLKLKYNKSGEYYFEISKNQASKLPDYFIRKQSLSNVERFTIEELLTFESEMTSSKTVLISLEEEIFQELQEKILVDLLILKENIEIAKMIDVLSAFGQISFENKYIRPNISSSHYIEIEDGRHPVVEQHVELFTANDLKLDHTENRLLLVFGPNMGGKSTFLRQSALIVLMAHIGCFVPAKKATIPLTDKIFTRIGASDNLAKGESTFLVEMVETAQILRNATQKSLIIMDEIGRGTSTNDGLAIAWAIIEYLTDLNIDRGRVLFATHYHQLAVLEKHLGIQNFHVSVNDNNGKLVFLHKVKKGAADKSYGIHVGEIAGLPTEVTTRAKELLNKLDDSLNKKVDPSLLPSKKTPRKETPSTLPQPETKILNQIKTSLENLKIESTTPLEAFSILQEWASLFKESSEKLF